MMLLFSICTMPFAYVFTFYLRNRVEEEITSLELACALLLFVCVTLGGLFLVGMCSVFGLR